LQVLNLVLLAAPKAMVRPILRNYSDPLPVIGLLCSTCPKWLGNVNRLSRQLLDNTTTTTTIQNKIVHILFSEDKKNPWKVFTTDFEKKWYALDIIQAQWNLTQLQLLYSGIITPFVDSDIVKTFPHSSARLAFTNLAYYGNA